MMRKLFYIILVAWISTASLSAAKFVVDKSQSTLAVDAQASPPHTFTSVAKDFQCDIELDPATLSATKAEVGFKFADLDSEKEKRDAKMGGWMDVDNHPDARFVLSKVELRNGETIGLGTFFMHGVTREIEVPFTVSRDGDDITIDGTAEFDYTNWNLKIVRLLIFTVKPELKVHFHLEGRLPIGAYSPAWFLAKRHMNPEEAVAAYSDCRAKSMIPFHFGAYLLSLETLDEPFRWFSKVAGQQGCNWYLPVGI